MSQARGFGHFVDEFVFGATFGRETEHGYARLHLSENACCLGGGDGNLRQFFGCGTRIYGAVGKYQQTIVAKLFGWREHEECARNNAHIRFCLDYLKRWTNGVGRGATSASQFAIGIAIFYHQATEIERIFGFLLSLFVCHAFFLAQFVEQVGINRHFRVGFGIEKSGFGNVFQSFFGSHSGDFLLIANEREARDVFGQNLVGCLERAWLVAFGQHNVAQVLLRTQFQLFDYFHGVEYFFAFFNETAPQVARQWRIEDSKFQISNW